MKLLTIKQPWASLICLGIKDVENRTWRQNSLIGEKILIMSSKKEEDMSIVKQEWHTEYSRLVSNGIIPSLKELPKGVILGYVKVVDIKEKSDSLWAAEDTQFKYILKDPYMFKFPIKGVRGQPKPINYEIKLSEIEAIPSKYE
jgi:hypothetical protein